MGNCWTGFCSRSSSPRERRPWCSTCWLVEGEEGGREGGRDREIYERVEREAAMVLHFLVS